MGIEKTLGQHSPKNKYRATIRVYKKTKTGPRNEFSTSVGAMSVLHLNSSIKEITDRYKGKDFIIYVDKIKNTLEYPKFNWVKI